MTDTFSAKELASLPMWPDFSVSQVNRLCREGKMFAYKLDDGPFASWHIPIESVAVYAFTHDSYIWAIAGIDKTKMEAELLKKVNKLGNLCLRGIPDEIYTFEQLSLIFDAPVTQVASWFAEKTFPFAFFIKRKTISSFEVSKFLESRPDRLKMLQERHGMLLANGGEMEASVRHLLALHSYYKNMEN